MRKEKKATGPFAPTKKERLAPMAHDKNYYRALGREGFSWIDYDDGLHYFCRRCDNGLFEQIRVTERQLTNGDFLYFVKRGLTL